MRKLALCCSAVSLVALACASRADAAMITSVGDGWRLLSGTSIAENEGTYWKAVSLSYDDATAFTSPSAAIATANELYELVNEPLAGDLADPTNLLPLGTYWAFEVGTGPLIIDDAIPETIDFARLDVGSSTMDLLVYHLPDSSFDHEAERMWVLRSEVNPVSGSSNVPEPSSLILMGTAALAGVRRLRRRKQRCD